jgi:hypothetical protein
MCLLCEHHHVIESWTPPERHSTTHSGSETGQYIETVPGFDLPLQAQADATLLDAVAALRRS